MSSLTIKKMILMLIVLSFSKSTKNGQKPLNKVKPYKVKQLPSLDVNGVVNIDKKKYHWIANVDRTFDKNQATSLMNEVSPLILEGKRLIKWKWNEIRYRKLDPAHDFFVDIYKITLYWGEEKNITENNHCKIIFSIYSLGDISANLEFLKQSTLCIIKYQNEKNITIPLDSEEQISTQENLNAIVEEHTFPKKINSSVYFNDVKLQNEKKKIEESLKEFLGIEVLLNDSSFRTKIIYGNDHVVYFYSLSSGKCRFHFFIYDGGIILENKEFEKGIDKCIEGYNNII